MDKRSIEYRKEIVKIVARARRGHIGSALSILEIIRVLYENILRVDPKRPKWENRDRFILSKGHGCLALYLMLAKYGFFPKKELYKFCSFGALLGGHPQYGKVPGVEASTGSLGHGLSIGVGIALNGKLDAKNYQTYVLLGDGECEEGSVWEAAMCASKYKLDNLHVLVDYNKMQSYGKVSDIQNLEPFLEKWTSFGFEVREVDGHDVFSLRQILKKLPIKKEKPSLVICHTVKGKGFPLIEKNASWHHKSKITDTEIQELFNELEQTGAYL